MPTSLTLASRMNFQAAKDLHGRLSALTADDVTLDASGVEFLGGLAAQTLIAGQRSWTRAGRVLRISKASPRFTEAVGELGLGALLLVEGGA